ncbi:MAG: hypothetical protein HUJ59_01125, partial [Bacilli bacterium]|nr:hypothetical protein [Bacilli bacterium]
LACVALGIVLAYYLKNEGEMAPAGGIFFTIGYIFFIISDVILIITTFVKDIEKRDFPIMLFYLLAQLFIISGLISIILQI